MGFKRQILLWNKENAASNQCCETTVYALHSLTNNITIYRD